jgi:hypothetical protein
LQCHCNAGATPRRSVGPSDTRSTADDDRRSIEIAVTDDGRAALLAAIESHLQLVASLFSDRLTATDQAALSWVLSKLLARTKPDCDVSREA